MESRLELIHMHRAASYYANMQERYDEGVDAEKIDTLKRMLKANLSDEMIAIATEFTVEQVAVFRSQFQIEEGTEYGV
ncbi:hypothetical protein [Streptococcus suis]|uniref:hypothetical protein n=1 Tax=Streptococcus suis TaxID=1307 RepID=UPI000CF47E40|nr:hypothetical protein [Streptococcus suis]HEM6111135.1 hypothetical protein [Streptococcus suis]HEM6319447.1 hypothetical protein [Streptococcus suis]HEM6397592.1 hypothetical protein [Streptococcus suis]